MGNTGQQRTTGQGPSGYFFANQMFELPPRHERVPGLRAPDQKAGKRPVASPVYGFPTGIPMYAGGK